MSEELDRDVASLLNEGKAPRLPPEGAKERVFESVRARILALPPGGGGGGAQPATEPAVAGATQGTKAAVVWKVAAIAIIFGSGAGTGLLLRRPPVDRIVYVDRVVTVTVPGAPPSPPQAASAAASAPPVAAPRPAASAARPVASPSSPMGGLAAERALLDEARAALARSAPNDALAAIARHEREFPNGTLTEEREAMAVKALAAAGRTTEARTRGARFRELFPNSVMLRSVEQSLDAIP
jgi:hypothetical protein